MPPPAWCRGVADFELYCAENKAPVTFEVLSALYDDPTDLEVIEDQHLRLRARACITQVRAVLTARKAGSSVTWACLGGAVARVDGELQLR